MQFFNETRRQLILIAAMLSVMEMVTAVSRAQALPFFSPSRQLGYSLLSFSLHLIVFWGFYEIVYKVTDKIRRFIPLLGFLYALPILYVLIHKNIRVRGMVFFTGEFLVVLAAAGLVWLSRKLSSSWNLFCVFLFWIAGSGAATLWLSLIHRTAWEPHSLKGRMVGMGLAAAVVMLMAVFPKVQSRKGRFSLLMAASLGFLAPFIWYKAPLSFRDLPPETATVESDTPNVLLLVVDTLRADALGFMEGNNQTPHFDRLASEGVVFGQAWSPAPYTHPSMSAVFASVHPSALNRGSGIFSIPSHMETFAEKLSKQGYRTGAVVANSSIGEYMGLYQGFQKVRIIDSLYEGTFVNQMPFWGTVAYRLGVQFNFLSVTVDTTRRVLLESQKFLTEKPSRPFFLWVHFFDPHHPYDPPERFRENGKTTECPRRLYTHIRLNFPLNFSKKQVTCYRALYDAEVRYVDDAAGKLLEFLQSMNLEQDTIVVFLSDHGEEFYEHGAILHGYSLYEENLHVPFVLKYKDLPQNLRLDEPVSTINLFPTLEDLMNMSDAPSEFPRAGRSLLPYIRGMESKPPFPFVCAELSAKDHWRAMRMGHLKAIDVRPLGRWEFYDLDKDSGEKTPISLDEVHRDELMRQMSAIEQFSHDFQKNLEAGNPSQLEDLLHRLKALGYIQ
jgi:arylsulfatase A-like enzyme